MKMTACAALAAALIAVSPAQAHTHVKHHYPHHRLAHARVAQVYEQFGSVQPWGWNWSVQQTPWAPKGSTAAYHGGVGARPAAWCGWFMRQQVGSDPGPAYNLARNWAHWGHAVQAQIGAIVVWAHHVGKIVGQQNGMWVVESGNDGHAVRTRPLSVAGAIAFRMAG